MNPMTGGRKPPPKPGYVLMLVFTGPNGLPASRPRWVYVPSARRLRTVWVETPEGKGYWSTQPYQGPGPGYPSGARRSGNIYYPTAAELARNDPGLPGNRGAPGVPGTGGKAPSTKTSKIGATKAAELAGSFPGLPKNFRAGVTSITFAFEKRGPAPTKAQLEEGGHKPDTGQTAAAKWAEMTKTFSRSATLVNPVPGVRYQVSASITAIGDQPPVQGVLVAWSCPPGWKWVDGGGIVGGVAGMSVLPCEMVSNPQPLTRVIQAPPTFGKTKDFGFEAEVTRIFAIDPGAIMAAAESTTSGDAPVTP